MVDPVDDFSLANPPSNAQLLDALAEGLRRERLRHPHAGADDPAAAAPTSSTTRPNETNKFDKNNFSHAYVRPMMAEEVVDVLNAALGVDEHVRGADEAPAGTKMVEVGASRLQTANLAYVLRIFGRPPRTTACDCERAMEPALPQTLFRMTDPAMLAEVHRHERPCRDARQEQADERRGPRRAVPGDADALPDRRREGRCRSKHRDASEERHRAVTDSIWALSQYAQSSS